MKCLENIDVEYSSSVEVINHRVVRKREKEERKVREKQEKLEEVIKNNFNGNLISEITIDNAWRRLPRPNSRKIERPSKEELEKLVWEKPTLQIGKDYGVSDQCIAKWCRTYGITKPGPGYWQKLAFKNGEKRILPIICQLSCAICNKLFDVDANTIVSKKYCSERCKKNMSNLAEKERRKNKKIK